MTTGLKNFPICQMFYMFLQSPYAAGHLSPFYRRENRGSHRRLSCPGSPSQETSELGFQLGISGVPAPSWPKCSGFGGSAFGRGLSLEHWRQKSGRKIPCDRRPPPHVAGKVKSQERECPAAWTRCSNFPACWVSKSLTFSERAFCLSSSPVGWGTYLGVRGW